MADVDAGLANLFKPEFVVSAKEVAAGKPAPDVYLECLRRLGCTDNTRCVACTAVHRRALLLCTKADVPTATHGGQASAKA